MNGFIFLDKAEGMTSFYAVRKLRNIIGVKKAGHAGTLDPMATGVLPVAFGSATRFIELFPTHNKAYEAEIKLGMTTDTLDITGNVLSEKESFAKEEELLSVLSLFRGKIKQIPPMYSAIQKDGKRLYELARQGTEVEREERDVEIYSLELRSFDEKKQTFSISVECSAGTYIRSLADDIGEKLGCGAVMTKLRRTKALGFSLSDAVTLSELEEKAKSGNLSEVIFKVEDVISYERLIVSTAQAKRFQNGGELETVRLNQKTEENTLYRVFSQTGEFVGIGNTDEENKNLFVKRVFLNT